MNINLENLLKSTRLHSYTFCFILNHPMNITKRTMIDTICMNLMWVIYKEILYRVRYLVFQVSCIYGDMKFSNQKFRIFLRIKTKNRTIIWPWWWPFDDGKFLPQSFFSEEHKFLSFTLNVRQLISAAFSSLSCGIR